MKKFDRAINRRRFLRGCLGAAAGSAGFWATQSRLQLALAQTPAASDYKALVCIFLFGGNDSYNMVMPRSSHEYDIYQSVRNNLAVPEQDILPLSPNNPGAIDFGLHPEMGASQQLFEQNRLAVLLNNGSMIEPVSKSDYQNRTALLPPQLFSHNDQQNFVQSLRGNARTGWAGRAADIIQSMNTNDRLSMNISLGGNNIWQSGREVFPYSISGQGVETFSYQGHHDQVTRDQVFRTLMQGADSHLFQREYAAIQERAWELSADVIAALGEQDEIATPFPEGRLATDLKMVARMISAREALGASRQVFFVGFGDFDTHGDQLNRHPALLAELSNALGAFDGALQELNLTEQVTSFTMSDFGRTLTSNGDGTDHAWGGHQLIMGGAVRGGDLYGQAPSLALHDEDDIGEGRIIPSSSVDQYGATLASWFGLPGADFASVFPNLHNFDNADLGFMTHG